MKQRPSLLSVKSENLIKDEGPSNSIEVMVRMRPLLEPYEDEVIWEVDEESNTIKSKVENIDLKSLNLTHPKYYNDFSSTQKFAFDNVLGTNSRTKDIYNKLLKKIVDSVVQGYNGTIFMYGQTTSGKTFTMLGTQKDPGILPHSLRTIFLTIPKMKDYKFTISVSYLEIYNEVINDLLVPGSSNLKILDDPKYGVTVKGLKRQEVATFEDAVYLMSFGEEHRKYRETNANEHSSRSHTIFQVFIESFQENTDGKKKRFSCLNLVDLAGSERLADNGGNEGQTGETGHINKSLFLLTNVIKKLADGKTSHIPYRDSKLTRILSNAVGGNSLTAVICAISPALQNFTQTLSTLRFASRAKRVKNAATENVEEGIMDQKLKEEVKNLREKLNKSEYQITRVNTLNVQLEDNLQMTRQEIRNLQKEMEDLRSMFGKENTRQMEDNLTNSSLLDIMNDDIPTRPISRLKNHTHVGHSPQTNELFFGDTIIALVEQVLNEAAQDGPNASIDNPIAENAALKEWSSLCLKSKQTYLKDLRNLQKTFADSLEELSHKFVSKEQNPEVHQQIKGYTSAEIMKIDNVQDKISDYIKRVSPNSLKDILGEKLEALANKKSEESSPKEQPDQDSIEQGESLERQERSEKHEKREKLDKAAMTAAEEAISKRYEEVLSKLEKKYDEIYSLVTHTMTKRDSEESVYYDDQVMVKKYSFDSSCNSPSYNSLADDSGILSGGGSATRRLRKLHEDRPSSIGKTAPKFESSFARLKPERERKSISYIVEDSAFGNGYLWGSGKDGRLGNSKFSNESNPVAIKDLRFSKLVCGYHNTFGVSQEGLVYGWGRNENGQLGTGSNINTPIPINVTGFNKVSIIDIACGWQHCLALSVDGTLFSWGCGDEGQLGHGDNFDLAFPSEIRFFDKTQVVSIACGHSQSAAITAEGSLYTWGHNSDYRLMNSNTRSVFIPTLTEFYKAKTQTLNDEGMEIVSLSMGATHMCVVTKNGNLYSAGRGHEGQLGVKLSKDMKTVEAYRAENEESSEEILCCYFVQVPDFGPEKKAIMVSCGEKYTLALAEDKTVYSFGDARGGCLGFECSDKEKKVFKPTMIERFEGMKIDTVVAGPRHAACITENGELYCWGFNYYDQLEVGEIEKDYYIPKKVEKLANQNVVSVSCGYFHTASLAK